MKKHSGTLSNQMSKSSRRQSLHTNKTQLTFGRSADQLFFFFFTILRDKAEIFPPVYILRAHIGRTSYFTHEGQEQLVLFLENII